jgi:Fe2+ or Zn2+ uptake regulation protein
MTSDIPVRVARRSVPGMTPRVQRVLALLTGRDRPTTAQDVHAELRAHGERTGLSTVYRALHVLCASGLLHEFQLEDGVAYRACTAEAHDHLICRGCGRIQEQRAAGLADWLAELARAGFRIEDCRLEVYGFCDRCARPGGATRFASSDA